MGGKKRIVSSRYATRPQSGRNRPSGIWEEYDRTVSSAYVEPAGSVISGTVARNEAWQDK